MTNRDDVTSLLTKKLSQDHSILHTSCATIPCLPLRCFVWCISLSPFTSFSHFGLIMVGKFRRISEVTKLLWLHSDIPIIINQVRCQDHIPCTNQFVFSSTNFAFNIRNLTTRQHDSSFAKKHMMSNFRLRICGGVSWSSGHTSYCQQVSWWVQLLSSFLTHRSN